MVVVILLALGGLLATYLLFRKDVDATVERLLVPATLPPMPGQTTTSPVPTTTTPPSTVPIDCGPITGTNFRCCTCKTRACPGKQGCCEPCKPVCLADCTNPATLV